jgi:ribosomal protein S18 acetylase RimI-like enzyme
MPAEMVTNAVEIREYEPAHQPWFEKLNRAWIEKYFFMEPLDYEILQDPQTHLINKGGRIFMAMLQDEMVGTVGLKQVEPGVFELTKMAVDTQYQGRQIGRALAEAAIAGAKKVGAHKIILYSNTKLLAAMALYYKLGFKEIPLDGPYKRTDIKMELNLT